MFYTDKIFKNLSNEECWVGILKYYKKVSEAFVTEEDEIYSDFNTKYIIDSESLDNLIITNDDSDNTTTNLYFLHKRLLDLIIHSKCDPTKIINDLKTIIDISKFRLQNFIEETKNMIQRDIAEQLSIKSDSQDLMMYTTNMMMYWTVWLEMDTKFLQIFIDLTQNLDIEQFINESQEYGYTLLTVPLGINGHAV